jgi:hypothetical protein
MLDGDNGAGWAITVCPNYREFVYQLPVLFFNHLSSVRVLSSVGTNHGMLGPNGSCHLTEFPLVDVKLPQLETLCLEHVFICDNLLRVLAAHANTVKYLSLKDCYGNFEQDNDFSWRDLFNGIIDIDCLALDGLEIDPPQGENQS